MKTIHKNPRLTVIGAGPGDPDLITLKAIKALKKADVVLYDALVNKALLKYVLPTAELIFVGKRKGCYAFQQNEINELIVSKAKERGHVVRLKGGDPFVFGRGSEELDYAHSHGLETLVVPGISSSLSVPANLGIPLTKRGVSESFWVITGTTKAHKLSDDIALAAKSTATVVILMGMGKLAEIVDIFSKEGKGKTPVAIIQNGTMSNEKTGFGTIETIVNEVEEKQLSNPAIIVIGEVVENRSSLTEVKYKVLTKQLLRSNYTF